ncbi:MAG: heavy-metal-associated domain-containing protein [Burkholderiales bacterium]|jgi:copper chaperone|nr:heavy-metal-associated domain-containing protein [Burkholderiales bacterium]
MIRFHVEGMTCGHCVKAVTQAIRAIDADATVSVSLPDKRVDVASTASAALLCAAIVEAGYDASAQTA